MHCCVLPLEWYINCLRFDIFLINSVSLNFFLKKKKRCITGICGLYLKNLRETFSETLSWLWVRVPFLDKPDRLLFSKRPRWPLHSILGVMHHLVQTDKNKTAERDCFKPVWGCCAEPSVQSRPAFRSIFLRVKSKRMVGFEFPHVWVDMKTH